MGFSRQENWSGLPFPSPGDRPNPVIKLGSPALQATSIPTELRGKAKIYLIRMFFFWGGKDLLGMMLGPKLQTR